MIKKALVIPYFGEWPKWFDLYLYSLGKNPSLDVLFFTDIPTKKLLFLPENAKFIEVSFEDYCKKVSEKLGITFSPSNPYKLCDLRPFFPIIHQEELKEYDYIGWGDIDLIYGDLEKFFPDSKICKYDILSVHSFLFSGHFLLMKNDASIYHNFMNLPNWKELMIEPNNCSIDEVVFSYYLTPKLKYARYFYDKLGGYRGIHKCWAVIMMQLLARVFYPQYYLKELWTTPKPSDNDYVYKNGHVFDNVRGAELPYIHFYFFKKPNYETCREHWKDDFYHLDNYAINNDISILFDRKGIWLHQQ